MSSGADKLISKGLLELYATQNHEAMRSVAPLAMEKASVTEQLGMNDISFKILSIATAFSPTYAKAWLTYSYWCYDNAKKFLSKDQESNGDTCKWEFLFSTEERADCMPTNSEKIQLYDHAVRGYAHYLSLEASEDRCMMVCLRLLRLSMQLDTLPALSDTLHGVLKSCTLAPWLEITSQLFARLSHPSEYVAEGVMVLLQRLAQAYPEQLMYLAIVEQHKLAGKQHVDLHLKRLNSILTSLCQLAPKKMHSVKCFVTELKRVAVLWDEAWLNGLNKLALDKSRRSATLEKEAQRVNKNTSLSVDDKKLLAQRKLVAIMRPILLSLEVLWEEIWLVQAKNVSLRLMRRHSFVNIMIKFSLLLTISAEYVRIVSRLQLQMRGIMRNLWIISLTPVRNKAVVLLMLYGGRSRRL